MKKQAINIFLIFTLISCSNNDLTIKNNQHLNDSIIVDSVINKEDKKMPKEENVFQTDTSGSYDHEESLKTEFNIVKVINLNDTIQEDLNGDGFTDNALFLTKNGKSGILITDGKSNKEIKIGLGQRFEEMGDDFSWVDYWGIVKDSSAYETIIKDGEITGNALIKLDNPSIVVRKENEGGGLITFQNGKYIWIHQAD